MISYWGVDHGEEIEKRASALARTIQPKHLTKVDVNVGAGGPKGAVFREHYQRGLGNSLRTPHQATKTVTTDMYNKNPRVTTTYEPARLTDKGRKVRNRSALGAAGLGYGGFITYDIKQSRKKK